jgi:hypothetical protein
MNDDIQITHHSQRLATATTSPVTIRPQLAAQTVSAGATHQWGWVPVLSLISAVGLMLVAGADALSRTGQGQYEILLWAGVLTVIVPIAIRLASTEPARRERFSLILLAMVSLYLVKVMHSPNEFIFSDELVHLSNGSSILQTGTLFNHNSILPVTPLYPGLEMITAAFASLSGLSIFSAGLIIIGVARVILGLALFLVYEEVSGSARVAGVAALLYATNANFLYWSAQFSYESLALPLAVFVMFVALRRAKADSRAERNGLTLMAGLGITAIVVTHHLTSYFVIVFFVAWTLLNLIWRLKSKQPASGVRSVSGPATLAVFSILMAGIWLVTVASYTVGYLSPVLGGAINSIIQIIAGEANTRQLFQSPSGNVAPILDRVAGFGSVLLMLLGLPLGLRAIWRHFRDHPVALIFAGTAIAYFAMLGLRLSPAAWETGNRASEFLFLGLAFVLAFPVLELWDARRMPRLSRVAVVGSVIVLTVGGAVAGWAFGLRLGRPLQVDVGNVVIRPQGFAAASWMRDVVGPGHTVATDQSNARLLLAHGQQTAYAGRYPDVEDLLGMVEFPPWQVELLQEWNLQYILVDRRTISRNNMEGFYFDETNGNPLAPIDLLDPKVYGKFDRVQGIDRLYDSGNIVIYDAQAVSHATPTQ